MFYKLNIITKNTNVFDDKDHALEYTEDKLLVIYYNKSNMGDETVLPSPKSDQTKNSWEKLPDMQGLVTLLLDYCHERHSIHKEEFITVYSNYFEKNKSNGKTNNLYSFG